jgi:hypothetical protein
LRLSKADYWGWDKYTDMLEGLRCSTNYDISGMVT